MFILYKIESAFGTPIYIITYFYHLSILFEIFYLEFSNKVYLFISIKEEIDVSGKEGGDSAVYRLGAGLVICDHSLCSVETVNGKGHVKNYSPLLVNIWALLSKGALDVISAVLSLFDVAVCLDSTTLKVEIAESGGKAAIENRRNYIAVKLLCHASSLLADAIELFALVLHFENESKVEHLVKSLGKVEIHNVVGLHNDVIQRGEIKGVIYIFHKI